MESKVNVHVSTAGVRLKSKNWQFAAAKYFWSFIQGQKSTIEYACCQVVRPEAASTSPLSTSAPQTAAQVP